MTGAGGSACACRISVTIPPCVACSAGDTGRHRQQSQTQSQLGPIRLSHVCCNAIKQSTFPSATGLPEDDRAKAAAAAVAAVEAPPAQAALDAVFGDDDAGAASTKQQPKAEPELVLEQPVKHEHPIKHDSEADFLASILADPEEQQVPSPAAEGSAQPAGEGLLYRIAASMSLQLAGQLSPADLWLLVFALL